MGQLIAIFKDSGGDVRPPEIRLRLALKRILRREGLTLVDLRPAEPGASSMPSPQVTPATLDDHVIFSRILTDIRRRCADAFSNLAGRTSTVVNDATTKAEAKIRTLSRRLVADLDAFDASTPAAANLYPPSLGVPGTDSGSGGGILAVEEHHQLGAELADLRLLLLDLQTHLAEHFSPAHEVIKGTQKAIEALNAVRSKLDALFARQHPAKFSSSAYYPSSETSKGMDQCQITAPVS